LVFRNILCRLRGDLVGTVAEVVVSTCNATLHSSVHTKLFYFTTKLQFNTHLTYYLHNNQKDLKLHLDRVLGGQVIKIGNLLKTTAELIGNNRGSADRIGKGGNYLLCLRKSADFRLKEKLAVRTDNGRILPIGLSACLWFI
jgi:hypothetical protein